MTRLKFLIVIISVASLLGILSVAVLAEEEPPDEVPPPYAGWENPFPWDDTSAQESGKDIYQRSCLGCHGISGNNIPSSDFSRPDYPQILEERPDLPYWILSEGRLDRGMPPYKSSLSDDQRWQALTYLWLLGKEAPAEPPPTEPPQERRSVLMRLTAPEHAQSGEPLALTAVLIDSQHKPIPDATVEFAVNLDFFANVPLEIGEAVTDDRGVAAFEYTPRLSGDIEIIARFDGDGFVPTETAATLTLAQPDEPFYEVEVGLHLPSPGREVFIGPQSAKELGEMGQAPASAFRLPGGILSWLWLYVVVVLAVWFAYFQVMYQVFLIANHRQPTGGNVRLLPVLGMIVAIGAGILLALMILTGPNSHFHLLR